jgi:uncharacterized repeat protein (TIGR03803 family)
MARNKTINRKTLPLLAAAAGCVMAGSARAGYTINTLATFNGSISGQEPVGALTLLGNTLYGTTAEGGASYSGNVFSVPLTGGTPTTLASFNSSNGGRFTEAGVTLSGNTLYGTSSQGGAYGFGDIFSVPVTGGSLTPLATFNGSNGEYPNSGLIVSGNTLYGTTDGGGANGSGTVFSVPVSGGSPTTLATFILAKGDQPNGLTLSGNVLYGTAYDGGASGYGIVFSVPVTGGSPTTLATFNYSNGAYPEAGVILSGSTLYGTTRSGGANGDGTVFSLPVTGGLLTTMASFNGSNGSNPIAGLTLSGNTLYGTTSGGGASSSGTIFSIPVSGGSLTTVAAFNSINGRYSGATLIQSGTTFYGTTEEGGSSYGNVFSLAYNHAVLSSTTPANFGNQVGSLHVNGSHGSYVPANASFAPTSTGYLAVSGFNPSTDGEIYALEITDSIPASLAADLADAANEINAGTYTGYTITASTTDPLTILNNGYDFYITITNDTLGTGSPYFGFDFTQLNGTNDTLSVTVVAAVPEPASVGLMALGSLTLLHRRRRGPGYGTSVVKAE